MKTILKNKKEIIRVIGYVASACVLLAICYLPVIKQASSSFLDPLRTKDITHNVVVIGIDDKTLQTLGAWPLNRSVFAELINTLEGTEIRGLVFDVLFLEQKENDEMMKSSLSSALFPIALGMKLTEEGVLHPVYPRSPSMKEGYVNVVPDKDGKIREITKPLSVGGECALPLALSLLERVSCEEETKKRFIYPRTITEFSLVDIVNGNIPSELLKDKVLFVGATTLDLGDYFIGLDGNKVAGVHVHSAMYVAHQNNLFTHSVNETVKVILLLGVLFIGLIIISSIRRVSFQLCAVILALTIVAILTVILFDLGWELPVVEMLICLIAAFVVSTLVRYAFSRRENIFIKKMFSRYVNKEVLQSLLKSDTHITTGESRELTILFSDIRGFTDFSETLSPEELTSILNDYFTLMVSEIFKEKGTVDKFMGDAVMAFWNAPLSINNHELHAVNAAIGMQESLRLFNQKNKTPFKMGIGVHVGDAVVGNIGGEERASYTALGDTVNTASRIEGATKRYDVGIIISEAVAMKVKDKLKEGWNLRKLDEVRLKGKLKSVVLYEVTELPVMSIEQYESAFALYQKGNFREASSLVQSQNLHNDAPSKVLLDTIKNSEIKEGFDGVFVFSEK